MDYKNKKLYFFPGCTLTTTAKENYFSLYLIAKNLGFKLTELKDWNCCGTSSAHSLNQKLAIDLALRNIALTQLQQVDTLLVGCPTCFLRLKLAHFLTKRDVRLQKRFAELFKCPFPHDLKIIPILEFIQNNAVNLKIKNSLNNLKFAVYYGCMMNLPPILRREVSLSKIMEPLLESIGGKSITWGYHSICCGTFLAVLKPHAVSNIINKIFTSAIKMGAECMVTACSMCHFNLEIRCTSNQKIPVFHFSELIALCLGEHLHLNWFKRHLINPIPLLKKKKILT